MSASNSWGPGSRVLSETQMAGEASSNDCTSCNANPEVIDKFPWLPDILGCWADISKGGCWESGNKVILRVRS